MNVCMCTDMSVSVQDITHLNFKLYLFIISIIMAESARTAGSHSKCEKFLDLPEVVSCYDHLITSHEFFTKSMGKF